MEDAVYRKDYNYGEIKSKYSGKLIKVSSPDPSADKLAQRIGGDSRVKFEFDPDGREFDIYLFIFLFDVCFRIFTLLIICTILTIFIFN